MKRIKLVFGLALFCAMTFGALKAYDYTHTTESEKLLLANVEALTSGETSDETGTLYSNQAGDRYCCKRDSNRTCGAATC